MFDGWMVGWGENVGKIGSCPRLPGVEPRPPMFVDRMVGWGKPGGITTRAVSKWRPPRPYLARI